MPVISAGCAGQEPEPDQPVLYELNSEEDGLVSREYTFAEGETEAQVEALGNALNEKKTGSNAIHLLPANVEIGRAEYREHQVYLSFSEAYREYAVASPASELLCRAALVKNFMQLDDVEGVSIFVDGLPFVDPDTGGRIGVMTDSSFTTETDYDGNRLRKTEMTLYFSNADGTGLQTEKRTVSAEGNVSDAKLVLNQLLEGPKEPGHLQTLDSDVEIRQVSVMDGVCYVNLSSEFRTQNYGIRADVILYSIVNSLTELPEINRVLLSIDGDSDTVLRNSLSLRDYYEKNQELLESE